VKRSLAFLAFPLVALAGASLVACGDDDDDEPDATVEDTAASSDTEPSGDTEPTDDTGATDDTGITLPDISLPDITVPGGTLPGGVTLPDISIPDISIPDISIPDMTEILEQAFPNLNEDQIDCLADGLGDAADFDPSQVMDLLGDCDIDPSDILPG
jgi:hypothetical protein